VVPEADALFLPVMNPPATAVPVQSVVLLKLTTFWTYTLAAELLASRSAPVPFFTKTQLLTFLPPENEPITLSPIVHPKTAQKETSEVPPVIDIAARPALLQPFFTMQCDIFPKSETEIAPYLPAWLSASKVKW
jgi:hypothetical protein